MKGVEYIMLEDKAYQIKELSDKLFEYFIVYGSKKGRA